MEKNINIDKLNQTMSFTWRLQSAKYGKANYIAYIDARDVASLLDDVVGKENWKDSYQEIKGNLFCSIGIFFNGKWIEKSDVGTPSDFEKQKGEASDAFKRAAVKWGIGRFLYDIKVRTFIAEKQEDKYKKEYHLLKDPDTQKEIGTDRSFDLKKVQTYLNNTSEIPSQLKKEISLAKDEIQLDEIKKRMKCFWTNNNFIEEVKKRREAIKVEKEKTNGK